jgi:hypothetical protein
MASNHGIDFVKDLVISSTATGLFDINGNSLATADIVGTDSYAYSRPIELSPKSIEHILTATCEGCTIEILLQISPDGVNWVDCLLSNGLECDFVCTANANDCTVQPIDVPILQFARIKIGNAGDVNGTCTVKLNFTLN